MVESGYFLTVPQILGALRRKWFSGMVLAALIVGVSLGVLLLLRDVYESNGQFYLRAGRSTMSLDPTATTGITAQVLDTRQSEIQSIAEILTSRVVVEETVRRVGVDRIIDQRSMLAKTIDTVKSYPIFQSGEEEEVVLGQDVAELERIEECVEYVLRRLSVKTDKTNYNVRIDGHAHTPVLAHDIVANLMDVFNEHYLEIHKQQGSLDFFESERAIAESNLKQAEDALRVTKNSLSLISVDSKRQLLQAELNALQDESISTNSQKRAFEAKVQELERMIAQQPAFIEQEETSKANAASDLMRDRLFELEVNESNLLSKYSEDHPLVQQNRDSIAAARKAFENQSKTSDENKKGINPVRQTLEIALMTAKADLESLVAKSELIRNEIDKTTGKMESLNSDEIRIAALERDVDIARDNYQSYAKKLEQSRIQESLDQNKISDLAVAQPASLVLEEIGPKRSLLMLLITFGAGVAGIAFCVFRDQIEYGTALAEGRLTKLELQTLGGRIDVSPAQLSEAHRAAIGQRPNISTGTGNSSEVTLPTSGGV